MANKHISELTYNAVVQTNDMVITAQATVGTPTTYSLTRNTPKQFESIYTDFLNHWLQSNPLTTKAPMIGNGTVDNPITVPAKYFEDTFVKKGTLDVTQIGDGVSKYLPVSGSYFSVNYPSNSRWWGMAAFLEPNGDLNVLAPVTNGIEIRYTYNTYVGWGSNVFKHVNNDLVYTLLQLPSSSWVSEIFSNSTTAMMIEYTHEDGTFGHGFVELNGTLDYVEHRMIDIGQALFQYFEGSDQRTFTTKPPSACILDGKRYIFICGSPRRHSPLVLHCFQVTDNGTLVELLNWRVTAGFAGGTRNTQAIRLTEGIHGDADGNWPEIIRDPDFIFTDADFNTYKRANMIQLAQEGSKLRLQLTRTFDSIHVPSGQGTSNTDLQHTFDITFASDDNGYNTISSVPLFKGIKYIPMVNANLSTAFRLSSPVEGLEVINSTISRSSYMRIAANTAMLTHRTHPAPDSDRAVFFKRTRISAYDQLNGRLIYDYSLSPTSYSNIPMKPPFTPLRNPTHCWFIQDPADNGNFSSNVHRGKMLSYHSANRLGPGSTWPVVLADIRGAGNVTYPLYLGDPLKGFALNNDREEVVSGRNVEIAKSIFTYAKVPPGQSTPNFATMGIYYSRFFFGNRHYAIGEPWDFEFGYDLTAFSTMELQQSFIDQWEAMLNSQWPTDQYFCSWLLAIAPTPAGKVATFNLSIRRLEDGYTLRTHGRIDVTYTNVGNAYKLTGIIPSTFVKYNRGASFVIPVHDNPADILTYSGVAMLDINDEESYFTMKEIFTTTNFVNAGGGRPGLTLLHHNRNTGAITRIREIGGRDNTGNVYSYPTITRIGGLGTIDASVAGGTHYVFIPELPDYAPYKEPYVLSSMSPAKGFFINILETIPVIMGGEEVEIKPQSIDLRSHVWVVENNVIYMYLQLVNGDVVIKLSTELFVETDRLTLVATITTVRDSIAFIDAKPVFRLGTYRVSDSPAGSAIPVTQGQRSSPAASWWSDRRYP